MYCPYEFVCVGAQVWVVRQRERKYELEKEREMERPENGEIQEMTTIPVDCYYVALYWEKENEKKWIQYCQLHFDAKSIFSHFNLKHHKTTES